jgi:peptidoglycan/LPS O-acetylase OafA/YrhL
MQHRLEGLHGVRGLAAGTVAFFHLTVIGGLAPPSLVAPVVAHFYLAVHVFFVLSAFALAYSASQSPTGYGAYLVKRFFRIAPLFYVLVAWAIYRGGWPDWATLAANLTFTFNLVPGMHLSLVWAGWSVGVEMLFYLVFPFLLMSLGRISWAAAAFAAAVILDGLLWALWQPDPRLGEYVYFFIGSNLSPFIAGICAYRVFARLAPTRLPERSGTALLLLSVSALMLAYADPLHLYERAHGLYVALWSVPFAMLCLAESLYPGRFFRSRALQWLGDRSYSIYLLHPVVFFLLRPWYPALIRATGMDGQWQLAIPFLVSAPVLLAAADLAYRLIESPGMRMGKRIAHRSRAIPAAVPESGTAKA